MTNDDVSRTLVEMGCIYKDIDDDYAIRFAVDAFKAEMDRVQMKGFRKVHKKFLSWKPFLFQLSSVYS